MRKAFAGITRNAKAAANIRAWQPVRLARQVHIGATTPMGPSKRSSLMPIWPIAVGLPGNAALRVPAFLVLALIPACATATPGSRPHDMSGTRHAQLAATHDSRARKHADRYDPEASESRERCRLRAGAVARASGDLPYVCWTSLTNPTRAHHDLAEEHRQRAADHRAASEALRAAEATACNRVDADDRDMSPFEHVEDIATVATNSQRSEVVIVFQRVTGMTTEWLQAVVDCHIARNAALGHDVPEMPDCPLVPNGVDAHVTATADGFSIAIRAQNPVAGREVVSRAERLRARMSR